MKFLGSKVLESEYLVLRPTIESDLKVIWMILRDKEVAKYYLVGKIHDKWEDELPWQYKKLQHAKDADVFQWSIVLKSENKCIGQISSQKSLNNSLSVRDVGWIIDKDYQHQGIGFEAAKLMLDYMFLEVGIDKIETCAAIINSASWRLMEKLGFKRIPKLKKIKYTYLEDEVECFCYELLRDEYLKFWKY